MEEQWWNVTLHVVAQYVKLDFRSGLQFFFHEFERPGLYKWEPTIWNVEETLHKNYGAVADGWKKLERSLSVQSLVMQLKKNRNGLWPLFIHLQVKWSPTENDSAYEVCRLSWFTSENMADFFTWNFQPRSTVNSQVCFILIY